MPDTVKADQTVIENRNRLRAMAGLPLLQEDAELKRLQAVREQAAFEEYFEQRRSQYAHLWSTGRGFITNMGMYAVVRLKLRDEMRAGA